jgi:hypothetical protein
LQNIVDNQGNTRILNIGTKVSIANLIRDFKNYLKRILKFKIMRKIIASSVFFLFLLVTMSFAQLPPHPNGGGGPGGGVTPVGGAAPIEGGFLIFLSLTIGYSVRKIYDIRKKSLEEIQ